MNIQEFIQTTLAEIYSGTKIDLPDSNGKHFYLDGAGVDFDLAVIVSEEKEHKTKLSAGVSIKVANLDYDLNKTKAGKSEYISRVKFTARFGEDGKAKVIRPRNSTLSKIY